MQCVCIYLRNARRGLLSSGGFSELLFLCQAVRFSLKPVPVWVRSERISSGKSLLWRQSKLPGEASRDSRDPPECRSNNEGQFASPSLSLPDVTNAKLVGKGHQNLGLAATFCRLAQYQQLHGIQLGLADIAAATVSPVGCDSACHPIPAQVLKEENGGSLPATGAILSLQVSRVLKRIVVGPLSLGASKGLTEFIQYRTGVWKPLRSLPPDPKPQYWIKFLDPWVHDLYPVLGLGFGTLIERAQFFPVPALDKNRSPI